MLDAKLLKARDTYLKNCRTNEMSEGTVENYNRVLRQYMESMERNGHTEPTIQSVADWKFELMDENSPYHVKVTTASGYINMLSAFFDWAKAMELLEKNPVLPTLKPSRKAVRNEMKRPYEHPMDEIDYAHIVYGDRPNHAKGETWKRNKAMYTVLLTTAIRNSELRSLTLDDVNFDDGYITIRHGKGDKMRYVAFPKVAQDAVQEYLDDGYRPKDIPSSAPLFGSKGNRFADGWHEIDRHTLSQLVERQVQRMTGKDGIRSHALRHASASIMLDKNMSMEEISSLLGHESVATTALYAQRLRPTLPSEHANDVFGSIKPVGA